MYYSVETFSVIKIPLINLKLPVKVKGETRVIVNTGTSADTNTG